VIIETTIDMAGIFATLRVVAQKSGWRRTEPMFHLIVGAAGVAVLVVTMTGAHARAKPLYCAIDDAVFVKREKTAFDLCYGDKCTRIDNLGTRMTQKPDKENVYTAVWSLGDLAGSKAELDTGTFNFKTGGIQTYNTRFRALGREATCDGDLLPALPDDQSRPRPQLICDDGKRSGFLGNIEPILDASVHQEQPGKPFQVGPLSGTRTVDDPGGSVVDLGEGITILREDDAARIVSKFGTATCRVEYPPINFGGRPITRPGIEVQDAKARAEEFGEAEERRLREDMAREEAQKKADRERLAATVSCKFSDGTWFKDGIMHTPGEPDLRILIWGTKRNSNEIDFSSPRIIGEADLSTGGAKMTRFDKKPDREYLGRCEKITN
jgi:hypothetical protein